MTDTPGFRFKDGKLYAFSENDIIILEAWPVLKALRKEGDKKWYEFEPRFRVVKPYRPKRARKQPQLELGLGEIAAIPSIAEQRRRAFDGFRFALPKQCAIATEKFQSRQWGLLKLLQNAENAIELARNSPALFFALANFRASHGRSASPEDLAKVICLRQKEIAGWLGFPGTESTAKILSKIPPESVSLENLVPLRNALNDPAVSKTLSHLQVLNAGVISIVLIESARTAVTPAFLTEVAAIPAEKYRASCVEILTDTLTMLREVKPNAGVPKIQSLARLRAMHDEVSAEFIRNQDLRTKGAKLPPPPLPGTKSIVPILTTEQLREEGSLQRNCVATYADRIRKGTTFIYRVTHPERATLSIVRGNDGDWQIGELKSKANKPVSAFTRRAIEFWLEEYATSA